MSINLFGCNDLSLGGIKELKLATKDINNKPLSFPLDIQLLSGDDSIIVIQEDLVNQIITIGGVEIQYRSVFPYNARYVEDEVTGRQGRYYTKTLSFEMPKLNLTTNNQLKDFLFSSNGEFAISSMICFVVDTNNNTWVLGWDSPLILQTLDLQTDINQGDNKYLINYLSNSYSRIRQYYVI